MAALATSPAAHLNGTSSALQSSLLFSLTKFARSSLIRVLTLALVHGASSWQRVVAPSESELPCVSRDAANRHGVRYPELVSGRLNATTLVVPIALAEARALVPAPYAIVEAAYRELLPAFPPAMYPMLAQIAHDHDVGVYAHGASIPDFSRASLEFPFVDPFGGHASFRWTPASLISANNPLAIWGARGYGIEVDGATFDPPCDAYAFAPARGPPPASGHGGAATYARARGSDNDTRFLAIEARPAAAAAAYPLAFLRNATNQPTFAHPGACDYYRRLFDEPDEDEGGAGAPPPVVPVVATVSAGLPPLPAPRTWRGVRGWHVATPFVEPLQPQACERGEP
ncbi:hypothetical protein GGS23DRAFT_317443 [Durotheca rogersii]|uniref:uncharacterized protein n=1 Tax=Durotheca rogersii TaxID=419775 RepID=UPI00221FF17B|nr:uncharacterized protein GGS23DRAFT_317443 [Durotheca rogersii]KAI5859435.1 hypothetical protein GGS23DRAFT_317443 [Durotheca rogersii]